MFTNFVGQKAFNKTLADFAYLLTANIARPLLQTPFTERAFSASLDILLKGFESLQQEKDAKRKDAIEKRRQLEETTLKHEAAEKARAEAEAFRLRQEQEQARMEVEKLAVDLRRQARLSFDSLSLGSWIEIKNEEGGGYFRAKLAVKFNATGRFVFVDQDGVTVIENQRDQLVDMVMAEKIRLLFSDETFAERLNKVVLSIRGDETGV